MFGLGGSNNQTADATIRVGYDGKEATRGLNGLIGTIKTVGVTFASMKIIQYTYQLAKMGAEALRTEKAFAYFAKQHGINVDYMVSAMKNVTQGLADDTDLQAKAMQGMLNGLSAETLVKTMEYATRYATTTGRDVLSVIDDAIQAMSWKNARAFQAIGINVKDSKNITVDALAAMETQMKSMVTVESDMLLESQRAKVKFNEMQETIGKTLVPAFTSLTISASVLLGVLDKFVKVHLDETDIFGKLWSGKSLEDMSIDNTIEKAIEMAKKGQKGISDAQNYLIQVRENKLKEIEKTEKKIAYAARMSKMGVGDYETTLENQTKKLTSLSIQATKLKQALMDIDKTPIETLQSPLVGPVLSEKEIARREEERKKQEEKKARYDEALAKALNENIARADQGFWDGRIQGQEAADKKREENTDAYYENEYLAAKEASGKIDEVMAARKETQAAYINLLLSNQETIKKEQDLAFQAEIARLKEIKRLYPPIADEIQRLITATEKKHSDERVKNANDEAKKKQDAGFDAVNSIINTAQTMTSSLSTLSDALTQREIRNLDKKSMSQREYDDSIAAIEEEADQRNKEFARAQQILILATTISATAQAVMAALAEGAPVIKWLDAAAVAAAGAIQIATIEAQNFAQGGLVGPGSSKQGPDDINAMLGRNEYVMPARQTAQNFDLLESIRNNTANTAAGVRGVSGGQVVYNFYGASMEQILVAQKNINRRQRTGTPI